MKVHKNLSLSEKVLSKLKGMKKAQAIKAIEDFQLFNGYPKEYAKEQNLIIYGKINSWKPSKEVATTDTTRNTEGNGKDNS